MDVRRSGRARHPRPSGVKLASADPTKTLSTEKRAHLVRAGRASPADLLIRVPELRPLRGATVALFGLGSIGAPIALELARACIGGLHILDGDFVDPATSIRWPLGLQYAGQAKTTAVEDFITRNYPHTRVRAWDHRLGGPQTEGNQSDLEVLESMLDGASLVVDATAESGIEYMLAQLAWRRDLPFLSVSGTLGGWGGMVVRIRPGGKGCIWCVRKAEDQRDLPDPPADTRDEATLQPLGCADPTFTGAGVDMAAIALTAVRLAISTLTGPRGGYPDLAEDVLIISLRGEDGRAIAPTSKAYDLPHYRECPACGSTA